MLSKNDSGHRRQRPASPRKVVATGHGPHRSARDPTERSDAPEDRLTDSVKWIVVAAPAPEPNGNRLPRLQRRVVIPGYIPSPSSNGFNLGPLFVHAYGLAYVFAVVGAILGVMVFSDILGTYALVGGALVVGAAIYVASSENHPEDRSRERAIA